MSYILDALKRSESERRGYGPAPDALLGGGLPAPAPARPLWPWLLGLALLANAGVLAVFLLLRDPAPAPTPVVTAPEPPLRRAPVPEPAPREAAPPGPVAETMPEPAVEPPRSASAAVTAPPPPAAQAPDSTPVAPAPQAPPAPAPAPVGAPWEGLPYLEELPDGFRNSVPEVTVDVHVFTDDPAQRFVLLDLRRYREGEPLPGGLRLLHITPDGLALAWQGRRFRVTSR